MTLRHSKLFACNLYLTLSFPFTLSSSTLPSSSLLSCSIYPFGSSLLLFSVVSHQQVWEGPVTCITEVEANGKALTSYETAKNWTQEGFVVCVTERGSFTQVSLVGTYQLQPLLISTAIPRSRKSWARLTSKLTNCPSTSPYNTPSL